MRRTLFPIGLSLALICTAAASAQSGSERARQARAELEQLRARIEQVQDAISEGRERHDELAQKLAAAGQAVREAAAQLDQLQRDIGALEQAVAALTDKRDREKAHLGDELDTLRAQVQAAYRTGRTNKLRLLLSGADPAELGRMLVYYEYFTESQSRQIAHLRDMLAQLAQRQSELEAKQQRLAERQAERAATLARLQRSRTERAAAMEALEARLAAHESSLDDYRTAANRLQDLISALDKKLTRPSPATPGTFAALKGRMRPPVHGTVLAYFGDPKANGMLSWQGQWRAASKGAPIQAVADGRVVYVGYMHHYGLIVVLEHADGYFTVYGHALSSYVDVGDHVDRNQAIARVGSSGGHSRNGVYFEIRKGRQALDPSRWLSG